MKKFLLLAAACTLTLGAADAIAKPDHPKHSKAHGKGHGKHWHGNNDTVVIHSGDRVAIRDYYRTVRHCPPGLARKNNGCMPPGQYKKYTRGQVLPSTAVYQEVPRDLLLRLAPAPRGSRYVVVDNNVLLVSDNSKRVMDVMSLLGLH